MIKFTIAIPAYKKKYLEKCLNTAFSQNYPNFEVVVVNDASPEDIASVVNRFKDHRLRYYVNETNCGAINVVDNWNKCLEYATGDYIICMGDDDELASNALDEYARLIKKYPTLNAFHARTILINEKDEHIGILNDRSEYEPLVSFLRHRLEGSQQFIGDFCFNTKRLRDIGGYYKLPLAWGSDDITAYLCAYPFGIANTYIPVFYYRINNQSISNNGLIKIKLEARMEMWNWLENFLKEIVPVNDVERLTLNHLQTKFRRFRSNSFMWDVYADIKRSRWRAIYWFLNKKKYNLNNASILKAIAKTYVS